ncbi:MAG TPA: Na/Pi symporter [Chitinophagaceae bacterium]|nr:Na/Pi symporter [Chitinophagaceae bacterium]
MLFQPEVWKFLAGIAIFLLGMNFLEDSLARLAGRSFKLFLRKQTANKYKAVGAGALITALLQSSSAINLMVLAFVGSGVLKMNNALAIMLGSNLGTTITSWIIVTAGFELSIENIALPVIAIGGMIMIFVSKHSRWSLWSRFLFGFGFLFTGLGFIKSGMEVLVSQLELSTLNHYPVIVFVMVGVIITSLIQSSSATVAIVLAALFAKGITLYTAMGVVLGSEIGTTIKLMAASVKSSSDKKRTSAGNVIINTVTVIIVFLFLQPVYEFIVYRIGIKNDLIALVFFQSLINIVSLLLFLPLLNVLGKFLEKRFIKTNHDLLYINKSVAGDINLSIDATEKEALHFIHHVIDFGMSNFGMNNNESAALISEGYLNKPLVEKYNYIKHLHGEIHTFCIQLQKMSMEKKEAERLVQLISCVRNCMYAAKSINDGHWDIVHLKNSSNDVKFNFYLSFKSKTKLLYSSLTALLAKPDRTLCFDELVNIYKSVTENYTATLQELYKESMAANVNEIEISTLINFNREMVTSFKSLIFGVKDYLLDVKQAEYFDELPGFIR